jgi:hypothetical protein
MMKRLVIALILALLACSATAVPGPLQEIGVGHYSGQIGSYAQGDTLALVYFDNPGNDPAAEGWIVFRKSTDGGMTWSSQNVVQATNCLTRPTLYYADNEILITCTSGTSRLLARSVDGGVTWQTSTDDPTLDTGRTFENSPYTERRNGQLKTADLLLPYPEYAQDDYCQPDDPEELQTPQVFTDNTESVNGTQTYLYGTDTFDGVVRTNSDIYIKQAGGGDNNGWPTFNAPVITGGQVISYSGTIPEGQVFRGGLIENAPPLEMFGGPRTKYNIVGPPYYIVGPHYYDPDHIMYVEVSNTGYTAYLGIVSDPYQVDADVYSSYPPSDQDNYLYTNQYTVRDTIWTFFSNGSCINIPNFVYSKLWIKGTFGSHQTWTSSDTIFILDDIALSNTPMGYDPSNNPIDTVTLISEKSIVLKYGYRCPVDSLRYHDLCGPDQPTSFIYADLYALGRGSDQYPRRDGVFTFEYQHPHPSVPAVTLGGTLYDNIDLHRYRFPQTDTHPWASVDGTGANLQIDYPWYNPLWPERTPYLERGTLKIWGSIYQQRQGYLHRPYYDDMWPSFGEWDQENDQCGGSSSPAAVNHTDPVLGIELANVNYPGATGTGVGYKMQYAYDPRRSLSDSPMTGDTDYQNIWKLGLGLHTQTAEGFERYYLKPQLRRTRSKGFSRRGNNALYSVNDLLLFAAGDSVADWSASTSGGGMIRSLNLDADGSALILQEYQAGDQSLAHVKALEPGTGNIAYQFGLPVDTSLNAATILPRGRRIVTWYVPDCNTVFLNEFFDGQVSIPLESWTLNLNDPGQYDLASSRMWLLPSGGNTLDVFLWLHSSAPGPNQPGTIFHARADVAVAADDPAIPPLPEVGLAIYPNPAAADMNVKVQLSQPRQHTVEIFNLKGQKVRSLDPLSQGAGSDYGYLWDGRDSQGRMVGTGIYFLRVSAGGKPLISKRICRM